MKITILSNFLVIRALFWNFKMKIWAPTKNFFLLPNIAGENNFLEATKNPSFLKSIILTSLILHLKSLISKININLAYKNLFLNDFSLLKYIEFLK